MTTKIYLIRHAAAEGNLYRAAHGQFNSTITPAGYRQLTFLRRRFKDAHLDAVCGSDLLRAQTTASALYVPRNLTYVPVPDLREIRMGGWEQETWGEIARRDEENYRRFNQAPDLWHTDGAETFEEVRERMLRGLRTLAETYRGKTIAAVSHGAAMRTLLGALQGLGLDRIGETPYSDNTAVSLIEFDGERFNVVFRDDASHLPPKATVVRHGLRAAVPAATAPGLWFTPAAQGERHLSLRAMLGEDEAGAVAFRAGENAIILEDLRIRESFRGNHYGVQLIGQAVKYARLWGLEDIAVTCDETMMPYFAHYGFQNTGREMVFDIRRVIREIEE